MQLLLDQSGVLAELEHTSELTSVKDREKAKKASNRLENLEALVLLAGLQDFRSQGEALLMDVLDTEEEADYPQLLGSQTSSSRSSSSGDSNGSSRGDSNGSRSSSSSSGGADSSDALRGFMDYCGLQGDGDEGGGKSREPRVQFLTMHASKGKEFACVVTPAFYEGMLPSDRARNPEELEQERNTAYVAVTRAMDRLLITWPKTIRKPGTWDFSATKQSRFLTDVVRLAKAGRLSGVEFSEKR
jgi:superfamily I DNA/RNA helicase